MPNHFHFLLHANEHSCKQKKIGSLVSSELQNGFRILQSSYANSINKQFLRTGSVFQQNTKFKLLNYEMNNFTETCFHYIHQNPLKAGLVNKLENWRFSSFNEYMSKDGYAICNKTLGFQLLDFKPEHFYNISYGVIIPELLEKIW